MFAIFIWPGAPVASIFSLGLFGRRIQLETVRYYDLSNVQGTARGWEREERILLCVPLRDAEAHLPMFFSHLRNFTYPHHLIDLAFLVSDSKDRTLDMLIKNLEEIQGDEDSAEHFGEISILEKDFGQKVNQDVESRHGFAAQASRRKLMAQARNWLLSASLRPFHSWVYWRDVDVETAPFTILEDLMRHNKDVIVPSTFLPSSPFSPHALLTAQMFGAPFLTGLVASSRTISIHGRSRRLLSPLPTLLTKTPSLSKVMPSTPLGGPILPTCATPTATRTWRWRSTVSVVSVSCPRLRSSAMVFTSRLSASRSTQRLKALAKYVLWRSLFLSACFYEVLLTSTLQ